MGSKRRTSPSGSAKKSNASADKPFGAVATLPVALVIAAAVSLVQLLPVVSREQAVDLASVMLALTGAVALALLSRGGRDRRAATRLTYAWTAFLGWAVLSGAVSGRVWSSLMGEVTNGLGLLALIVFTIVVVAVSRHYEQIRAALEVVAVPVVVVQCVVAVAQLLSASAGRGTLPNATYFGEALLLALPFLIVDEERVFKIGRNGRVVLAVFGVMTLAASGARIPTVFAFVWLVWVLAKHLSVSKAVKVAIASILVVAAVAGAFVFNTEKMLATLQYQTLGERPGMYKASVRAALDSPIFGYGADGFVAGGSKVITPEFIAEGDVALLGPGYTDPHNIVLWALVSFGFVGAALFVWALLESVLRMFAARADHDRRPEAWAVASLLFIALSAPVALQVLPFAAVVFGLAVSPSSLRRAPAPEAVLSGAGGSSLARALPVAATIVVAVLLGNALTRFSLEDNGLQRSLSVAPTAQTASDFWRADPHLAYLASLHWGWVQQATGSEQAAASDIAAIERAVSLDRHDALLALQRARTLSYYGYPPDEVDAAFAQTFSRWSLYPLARAEYAIYLHQTGRPEEARAQLELAKTVDHSDPVIAGAIAAAEELLGD